MKRQFELMELRELAEVAKSFFIDFKEPSVCTFTGEMGAGKTTLIAALCAELGVEGHFGSPTYSLVNEYKYAGGVIYHFDCYRLNEAEEALDFGIEEYLDSSNWCFIEWPAIISDFLPKKRVEVSIQSLEGKRVINWYSVGF